MFAKGNFTLEYLNQISKKRHLDPSIMEKTLFAFGLLDALARVETPFIFKGGTSLMLLLQRPMRLSTDIDILVNPNVDIEPFIKKAATLFPFERSEEDHRKGSSGIVKKHYQFFYHSIITGKENAVLLDVVFEDNPYKVVFTKEIKCDFFQAEGEPTYTRVPSIDSILGDKLTAFAPNTVGIHYLTKRPDNTFLDKKMEVIKQFFDVATLLGEASDFEAIKVTYETISALEIGYRGLSVSSTECLLDTFHCAASILSRGKLFSEDYKHLLEGMQRIKGHIFGMKFGAELACSYACSVMLLAAGLLTQTNVIQKNIPLQPLIDYPPYEKLNFFVKVDRGAYDRAAFAVRLLKQYEKDHQPR